jgi:hypothetical protein
MGEGRGLEPYSSAVLPYKKKNKLQSVFTATYDKNIWFNHVLANIMKTGGKAGKKSKWNYGKKEEIEGFLYTDSYKTEVMLENEDNREAFILDLQIDYSYHVAHIIKLDALDVPYPNYH